MMIIAQFFGILGTITSVLYLHSKSMKNVLYTKLCIDIFWGTHYILLGGLNGFFVNLVCCFRELVFLNSDKKFFKSKLWLLLFVLLNWCFAIFNWKNIYSFLPAMGSTLATFSFWQKNITVTRCIAMVNNILFFIYDVFVASYAGMLCETITFISVLTALIISKKRGDQSGNS